jgi:hypothetical protein
MASPGGARERRPFGQGLRACGGVLVQLADDQLSPVNERNAPLHMLLEFDYPCLEGAYGLTEEAAVVTGGDFLRQRPRCRVR